MHDNYGQTPAFVVCKFVYSIQDSLEAGRGFKSRFKDFYSELFFESRCDVFVRWSFSSFVLSRE